MAIDSARRAEYSKLTQSQKTALDLLAYPAGRPSGTPHAKRAKDRRRRIQVTEGKVIAELTLYFWKRLYSPEYEQALWRTTLKRTFPDKKLTRAEVATNLEIIYQSRNRLAHPEPVLNNRFDDTLNAVAFVTQRLGQTTASASTPLAKMLRSDVEHVRSKADALHARLTSYRV